MKQITMTTFGNNGRLGNQLFQYASMIGISKKFGAHLKLPTWKCADYFEGDFPVGSEDELWGREVKETTFCYVPDWPAIKENEIVDVYGYLQSYKYWQDYEKEVRSALTFKKEFVERVKQTIKFDTKLNPIALSIRRGDYVGNPNYHLLPIIGYYYKALIEFFDDWKERDVIIFSDDIPYCRNHFGCLPNVTFSENNSDIEDVCLMAQCDDFIIGNSTFSWWGSYLSTALHKTIIRPVHHFNGQLLRKNDIKDYYPPQYYSFNHQRITDRQDKKIQLIDVSFQIPVYYDHPDREENLKILLRFFHRYFEDAEVYVTEMYDHEPKLTYLQDKGHFYCHRYDLMYSPVMHRTKALNNMARNTKRRYIFNWDVDVFIAPLQILQAVEMLRSGADMVYPYKWAFARMPRNIWLDKIRDYDGDVGLVGDTRFNGMNTSDVVSLGGAVGFDKESFIDGGMENENFISYGAEDVERMYRFEKLGYRIERVLGNNMYHLNHWVGPNSLNTHKHFKANDAELKRIKAFTKEELRQEINTWPWKIK